MGGAAGRLGGTIQGVGDRIGGTVESGAGQVSGTLARSFREPLLIRAPLPLPLEGGQDGQPLRVEASILGGL